jgi:hypothetical protein
VSILAESLDSGLLFLSVSWTLILIAGLRIGSMTNIKEAPDETESFRAGCYRVYLRGQPI